MKKLKLSIPLYFKGSDNGRRRYALNMNQYSIWHYRTKNNIKKRVSDYIGSLLVKNKKTFKKPKMDYIVYLETKRRADIMNYVAVVEKFTADALQKYGVIEDDDYKTLQEFHIYFGGIDKENPRIELVIYE